MAQWLKRTCVFFVLCWMLSRNQINSWQALLCVSFVCCHFPTPVSYFIDFSACVPSNEIPFQFRKALFTSLFAMNNIFWQGRMSWKIEQRGKQGDWRINLSYRKREFPFTQLVIFLSQSESSLKYVLNTIKLFFFLPIDNCWSRTRAIRILIHHHTSHQKINSQQN